MPVAFTILSSQTDPVSLSSSTIEIDNPLIDTLCPQGQAFPVAPTPYHHFPRLLLISVAHNEALDCRAQQVADAGSIVWVYQKCQRNDKVHAQ